MVERHQKDGYMNKKHMPLYIYNYSTMHYQNIIKQDISEKLLKGFYLVYVIKYEKKSHKRSNIKNACNVNEQINSQNIF